MDESIVERIIALMEYYSLSPSAFADRIDVQRSSMSHLVSGRNKPSLDFIQKVLNQFIDINPTWLIMGTGPMKQLALFDDSGKVSEPVPLPITAPPTDTETTTNQEVIPPKAATLQEEIKQNSTAVETVPTANSLQTEWGNSISESMQPEQVIAPTPEPKVQPNPVPPVAPVIQHPNPANIASVETSKEKTMNNDKKVVKIVFFYSDNTFESFNPQ